MHTSGAQCATHVKRSCAQPRKCAPWAPSAPLILNTMSVGCSKLYRHFHGKNKFGLIQFWTKTGLDSIGSSNL